MRRQMILGMLVTVMLLATVGPVMAAMGPPEKVDICHLDGHGTYHLIRVSERALPAHLRHGDVQPGTIVAVGEPYTGSYGSTVTLITTVGEDCSTVYALKIVTTQSFSQGQQPGVSAGWAGWSCVETGYPHVVGGGVIPEDGTIIAQGPAEYGAPAIDGWSYPVYPHYTYNGGYNTPGGEEGWVVEAAGPTPPTSIYVLCGV